MSDDEMKTKDERLLDEMLNDTPKPATSNQLYFLPGTSAGQGGKATPSRSAIRPGRSNAALDERELEALDEERRQFIANDPVVQTAGGKDPLALLFALKMEVAREAARLSHQQMLLERAGKDCSSLSKQKIDAYKKIADIELEMRKLNVEVIDVRGEKIQRIYNLWVEIIKKAAVSTLDEQQADLFFNKLTSEMQGWLEKAEDLVR